MLADGASYREIARELGCSSKYVALWKSRFQQSRLAGLDSRHQGRRVWVVTPKLEAKVIARTRQAPPDGSTHWSSRKLSRELGISHVTVAQIWKRAGLKPHRLQRYMVSNDPRFEEKAADIIGLYINPPRNAAVSSSPPRPATRRSKLAPDTPKPVRIS